MNDISEEKLVDYGHGYDVEKMKRDLKELDDTIAATTHVLEHDYVSDDGKTKLKRFNNRCKLMRYRIKSRIDILTENG